MKLTAAARQALPDSAFADPAKRAYPMEDAGHRKSAAARVAEFGSDKQKAQVKRKLNSVHAGVKRGYTP